VEAPKPIPEIVRFGEFEVDVRHNTLKKNGIRVKLPPQPFSVLSLLIQHHGELVTRQEIREEVWGNNVFVDYEHGLNLCIKQIRSALGDLAVHPRYIETEPRRGYRFVAPVEEMSVASTERTTVIEPTSSHEVQMVPTSRPKRTRWFVYASFVVLLLVAFSASWRLLSPSEAPQLQKITLVVLPFVNLSGDTEQEYFVDGMTDAVIADLAQISGMRVISRTSAMQYKQSQKPLREIARKLNADLLVEGSVFRSNEKVRITTQLIQASTDSHLWARSFEYDMRDVLSLQREVAWTIAQEVRVKLTSLEQSRFVVASPVKPEVYESYLKGRYFMQFRTEEGLKKGVQFFLQSVAGDPQFAMAFAGLADAYALFGNYGLLPPRQAYPKAKEAAIKALEIDGSIAEAHTALAIVRLYYDWDFSGAQQSLQRAIELKPSYATAHHAYGMYFAAIGRMEEAVAEVRRARELDPLSLIISSHEGWIHHLAQQEKEALASYRRALDLNGNFAVAHWGLGVFYQHLSRSQDAIEALQEAVTKSGRNPEMIASLANAYATSGNKEQAVKLLAELKELANQRHVSSFDMALVYTGLGEKTLAIKQLELAYIERAPQLVWIKSDFRFQTLRSEPKYSLLQQRMGFPN
jgi:TolB-like protein/DNA-binding winged helix-turn-helix (wHTH) protein/Flp pilus assembly protein TadD